MSRARDVVARCGYRCDLCLAHKTKIRSPTDQERISDGWFQYFGFRIPPEKVRCDGCLAPDSERPHLIDKGCPVRACILTRGIENCAHCDAYPCEKLTQRFVDRDALAAGRGAPIPEEDYLSFVEPYEGRKVLDAIRRTARRP